MSTTADDFALALDRIGRGKYVSLTTFRRDGRTVATPVGCVVRHGILYVLTPPDSGKVKRIRNNPRVTLAPCGMNGTVPAGAPITAGTARLLGGTGAARVRDLMRQRFLMYRLVLLTDHVLRRERPLAAIAVSA
ncbi:PPOX class F420-dependent oxidoreductase [Streptomyces sp. NPDC006333]|uniref:PPOX class F420-dependent oxidoreductase n=1 Tax=Streptomyces sp. NPDC006333 TaxID=3156753 RepID=UPI0033A9D79B